jgi:FtsP/CotA-like multicopper oxidase with cupredoxin domain
MAKKRLYAAMAAVLILMARPAAAQSMLLATHDDLPAVAINDNRRPAGVRKDGTLVLQLRAGLGAWRPEGAAGPALEIEAFGEEAGPLQAPAPLIRVSEGTEIVASISNELAFTLRVHGLCSHDGAPCPPIEVPPSSSQEVRFKSGRAGTYHYWATTSAMPPPFRDGIDMQLSGAFIVDPPGASADADRVLVITEWHSLTREQLRDVLRADDPGVAFLALNPQGTFLINGLAWPATEHLTYRLGDNVRWRVLNLSTQQHPMHLHGFYYDVDSLGDGLKDVPFAPGLKPHVVTQLLSPGATMAMTWQPERVGNWLFHCHIAIHISPERRLTRTAASHDMHHSAHDEAAGMAGMVLDVTVIPRDGELTEPPDAPAAPARKMTLVMRTEPNHFGVEPAYGFELTDADATATAATLAVPGPTLTLRRKEPVEITLVNRLPEATAIHWHGIELDSYYDGVHGWSGAGSRVTPLIEPGESFTVRLTPPRAGTFIYHTHLHDDRQLVSGMYGALLVLDQGETFDPALDHVIVIGRGGPGIAAQTVVNGVRDPQLALKAGVAHRLRFINITPDDIFVVSLASREGSASWRPLTKDGAPVPPDRCVDRPATQIIAVGETFDFEYRAPAGRQSLWMEVRTPAGRWQVQGRVVIK